MFRRKLGIEDRARWWRGVVSRLATLTVAALALDGADVVQAKPAGDMHDLQDVFAGCFHPPREAADTRVTFYFSLNSKGGVIGRPRTTWIGFKGSDDERARELSAFETSFEQCLPLSLDPQMASTIPGKVFFLQYIMGPHVADEQVLLRPFGSHGGFGPRAPLAFERSRPDTLPVVNPGLASPPAPHVQFRRFRQPLRIPFRRFYPDRRVGAGH